ncbi:MexE family multidrug efflux RND transporter periplasmic adaptor subunit [Litchfieldella qijiaojingensis]|uniref:MexE family multidrug efflux RND transporter periplasmic adaptor subunit n=2 Tax=Litchfieldella qijiaojingensis TaxID=980347 RepID=A0ABQ2YNG6_9GAMM|nr:efflux RND transporter periplasmic adaptor subunit [Halomonas qijiaojingensis]GGX87723.1 MexE family multidrug efflux RND transporter periplasmic adaptor subunit [Halomonas qijiaojingensis]
MVISMLLGLAFLAGCDTQADSAQQQPPPPEVSVAEVVVKDVSFWDEFTGHIEAVETVELRPRVAGYIERINYTEGQIVDKGDVLFVIDQRPYRAELARAEADLQRAQARAELARAEAARAEALAQTRAISREELDQRRAASAEAEADVLAARAVVETASLNMEYTEVRAPIAGRTGRALVTAGNLVSDTTPLTSIVSLDQVHVHFFADEQSYLRYGAMERSGERPSSREERTPVRVGLASDIGYPYEGEVDFVDNQLDTSAGTILMRAVLDNRDGRFAPGMFARVQLRGNDSDNALLIDDKAVLTDQDRKYVYVVDDQGVAVRKDVQLGRMAEGLRVINSGLDPGDRVVVRGAQRIFFPGMPVAAQNVDMSDSPLTVDLSAAH